MSLAVGKRNFGQNFSETLIDDFPKHNLHLNKLFKTSQNPCFKTTIPQINLETTSSNLKTLKEQFPTVADQELLTVLDDCDNNLEIAREILQKSENPAPKPMEMLSRNVRKLGLNTQTTLKKPSKRVTIIENNKPETFQVEDPDRNEKIQQTMALSTEIIDKLQTLSSMDEAREYLANTLFNIQNEVEKSTQEQVKKIQDDKTILIKAFAKQREKAQDLQEKNGALTTLLGLYEQGIQRLKGINYNLELRVQMLDPRENEQHISDHIF